MAQKHSVSDAVMGAPDKIMSFETGQLAGLADGSVLAQLGNTMVLVTATASDKAREGASFFPLTVDMEERSYAAGKIPGSFFRREGRASEAAILVDRLTDRPLRPNFPDGFRNDVHVVGTIFGADQENPYDVLAINAASAALIMSRIPFECPVGAARIAFTADGEWIPHPTYQESADAVFDMVVAGRLLEDDDVAIMMVEAGGTEKTWAAFEAGTKVDEDELARGLEASKKWIRQAIELQEALLEKVGAPTKMEFEVLGDYTDEVYEAVKSGYESQIAETQKIPAKMERQAAESALKDEIKSALADRFPEDAGGIGQAIRSLTKSIVRARIANEGIRIDGRKTDELRPVSSEVDLIPTAHGSGLFQRGDTQVMNVTTLGMGRMDQMIDGIDPIDRKRYMHHYNFPPFSTGEPGFMRGPKRREIGHGALAERAVLPVVPSMEEFPYTLRLVSEVLASNGSSSMASACSSSLSLMDAGVPIKAPVAGIAMGLVKLDDKYVTLTDILGAEDAMGDMDFKITGTSEFITALQLDTKIDGIPADVLSAALQQAKEARMAILDSMTAAIPAPRDEVGPTAPKIVSFEIPIDKIGEVIGPKGKVINAIQAETGADLSVDDDGMVGIVAIASPDRDKVDEAERQVRLILDPPTAEVGEVYQGKVVNITKFGAFVNILPGRDGLVHISKLGGGKRIDKVEDVVSLGDDIEVKVEDIDPNGKISLRPTSDGGGDSDSGDSGSRDRGRNSDNRGDRGGREDGGGREDRGNDSGGSSDREVASFEDSFDAELSDELGDLGPAPKSNRGGRGRRRR
ncbi:MAG: polyribonucleotide nucleotidyltransferase [Acidimicrobiales bacterium]|nr:polyribonucleotide nucleotidyltransferase [Acidimicrobiia bacterium]NNC81346.1 polyribonucleotide nucleotidyltransferase [Acidimicrobiales bacterium]